jgi:hypothetical protein
MNVISLYVVIKETRQFPATVFALEVALALDAPLTMTPSSLNTAASTASPSFIRGTSSKTSPHALLEISADLLHTPSIK